MGITVLEPADSTVERWEVKQQVPSYYIPEDSLLLRMFDSRYRPILLTLFEPQPRLG